MCNIKNCAENDNLNNFGLCVKHKYIMTDLNNYHRTDGGLCHWINCCENSLNFRYLCEYHRDVASGVILFTPNIIVQQFVNIKSEKDRNDDCDIKSFFRPIDDSVNSINDIDNDPVNDSVNDSINDIVNNIVNDSVNDSVNVPVNVPVNDPVNDSANDIVNDPVNDSVNVPVNDIVNDSVNVPVNDIVNDSVNDSVNDISTYYISNNKSSNIELTELDNSVCDKIVNLSDKKHKKKKRCIIL